MTSRTYSSEPDPRRVFLITSSLLPTSSSFHFRLHPRPIQPFVVSVPPPSFEPHSFPIVMRGYSSESSSSSSPPSPTSSTSSSSSDDDPSTSHAVRLSNHDPSNGLSDCDAPQSSKKRKLSLGGDASGSVAGHGEDVSIATCQWNDCGEQFGELNTFIQHIHDGQSPLRLVEISPL